MEELGYRDHVGKLTALLVNEQGRGLISDNSKWGIELASLLFFFYTEPRSRVKSDWEILFDDIVPNDVTKLSMKSGKMVVEIEREATFDVDWIYKEWLADDAIEWCELMVSLD